MQKYILPLKKLLAEWKSQLLPSEQQKEVQRWLADGGDSRFRFDYPLGKDSIVLDCGGYKGQWASDLFSMYQCHVHVFEPAPSFAAAIARRFAQNDKITVHDFALGGSERTEQIRMGASASSVFGAKGELVPIRFKDVAQWLDEAGIHQVDLFKINIEGGEYELLDRVLEAGIAQRFRDIQVQFHDFVPEAEMRMERIRERLALTHRATYQYRFVWDNWTRK